MIIRSLLGALTFALATPSLAQLPPLPGNPPPGGIPGGSGSPPNGTWMLQEFLPQGTMRYFNQYGLVSSYAWPSFPGPYVQLSLNGHWPINGRVSIIANPSMKLQWSGLPEQFPTVLHVKLKPEAVAEINDGPWTTYLETVVGRFDNILSNHGSRVRFSATGPLYKTVAPSSSGLASIPPIAISIEAECADFRGPITARATYGWEVLPQLLVTQYELVPNFFPYSDGVVAVRNFHKGQNGEVVEATRDRNGKLVLHVAMTKTPSGRWDQVLNLGTTYSNYSQPFFEFDGGGSQTGISNHDRYYLGIGSVEGTHKYYKVFRSTDKVFPDSPGTAQISTTVRDLADAMAPTIEQQTEIVWHYPIENTRLIYKVQNQDVLPHQEWAREDANFPRVGNIGRPSYWRTFYSEANSFEAAQAQSASWWLADFVLSIVPIPWFADALVGIGTRLTEDMFTPKWHMEECSLQIAWQSNLSSWDGSSARPPISDQYRYTFKGHVALKADMYYFKSDTYGYSGYEGDDFASKYAIIKGFEYYGSFNRVGGI